MRWRAAVRASQIAYPRLPAQRILVMPMSPGVSQGPWAQALSPRLPRQQVPFT